MTRYFPHPAAVPHAARSSYGRLANHPSACPYCAYTLTSLIKPQERMQIVAGNFGLWIDARPHFVKRTSSLRWGVTSEQDASEVCREIINKCRPRFLCMLGGLARLKQAIRDAELPQVLRRASLRRAFSDKHGILGFLKRARE